MNTETKDVVFWSTTTSEEIKFQITTTFMESSALTTSEQHRKVFSTRTLYRMQTQAQIYEIMIIIIFLASHQLIMQLTRTAHLIVIVIV